MNVPCYDLCYDLCNKLDCVNVVVDKDFIFCTCFILHESLSDKVINTLYRSVGAGIQYWDQIML